MPSYPPEDEKGLTTPFGMLRFAEDYRLAARKVHGGEELLNPAYTLLGHSIELALKAYLLARKVSLDELSKRPYGHNLDRLWEEATKRRIERVTKIPPIAGDVISSLNRHFQTHEFRYVVTGTKTVPYWNLIEPIAKALTHGLHDFCLRRRVGKEAALKRIALRGKF